jgi:hypothetical protein
MTQYGSSQGRYAPNATRASGGRQYEERPPRRETPDTAEIVSYVMLPGRQTKAFQIFDHPKVNDDGVADCIIFTKDGVYIPLDHHLSTVPIEIVVRAADIPAVRPPRRKGRPAAKTTRKPTAAAKTPAARKVKA